MGISIHVLSYFEIATLSGYPSFNYSNGEVEHFGDGFHRLPLGEGIWMNRWSDLNIVRQLVLCGSAVEAVFFLNFNQARYQRLDEVLFICFGNSIVIPQSILILLNNWKIEVIQPISFLNCIFLFRQLALLKQVEITFCMDGELLHLNTGIQEHRIKQDDINLVNLFRVCGIRRFFKIHSLFGADKDIYRR